MSIENTREFSPCIAVYESGTPAPGVLDPTVLGSDDVEIDDRSPHVEVLPQDSRSLVPAQISEYADPEASSVLCAAERELLSVGDSMLDDIEADHIEAGVQHPQVFGHAARWADVADVVGADDGEVRIAECLVIL